MPAPLPDVMRYTPGARFPPTARPWDGGLPARSAENSGRRTGSGHPSGSSEDPCPRVGICRWWYLVLRSSNSVDEGAPSVARWQWGTAQTARPPHSHPRWRTPHRRGPLVKLGRRPRPRRERVGVEATNTGPAAGRWAGRCAGGRRRWRAGGPLRGRGWACPGRGVRRLCGATAKWCQLLDGGVDAAEPLSQPKRPFGFGPVDQEAAGLPAQRVAVVPAPYLLRTRQWAGAVGADIEQSAATADAAAAGSLSLDGAPPSTARGPGSLVPPSHRPGAGAGQWHSSAPTPTARS
jgi:hypothetical protein